MVAVKGKVNSTSDKVNQKQKLSSSGQVNNFKIYVEADKVKKRDTLNNGTKGKSIIRNSGNNLPNVGDSKSGIKNLEKRKSKVYIPGDSNVGRKVLADIGNVRSSSFLKSQQGKCSKPGFRKSEMMLPRERDAMGWGNKEATSSDKSSRRGSSRPKMIQATDNNPTSKKSVRKNVTSHEPRTKFQSHGTATLKTGKNLRNPLRLTRKSMPLLKQAHQSEASGSAKQENSEKSSKGKHGFPVKPRRSTVSKTSNVGSRPWGSRVSDGFVVMASRTQTKLNSGVSLRMSIKPTVKPMGTALSTRENSKSHHTTKQKLRSSPADISKRKQEKVPVSKDIPSGADHVESISMEEGTSANSFSNRKSGRRSSFISTLMSKSKLLKEGGKVASPETLPNIYDDRNHLEVTDYVDDIYQYYWVMEGQNPLLKNYMSMQNDITPHMRGILINWLVEVHQKFDLMEETLFLTITLLDRYLSLEIIKKNEFQMVGLTSLLLASKYEDFWHPRVSDLISIAAESYTRAQMLEMEKMMLKKLKFRLNQPTAYVFMLRFLKAAQSNLKKFEHLAFYLIELCLIEYEALNYKPSMLCASAIYIARCTLQITPPWTPLLTKHTRYDESQIRDCAEMILKFHKAAKTNVLKVTYEKYMTADRSRVAASTKPLDRLPA